MARQFGQLDSVMWRDDEDWRSLPADAQWLYGLLVSQMELTVAGVLSFAIGRWRHMCADMTPERFTAAMVALEDGRFIVVDHDSEELLVRSFARRKTQWSNPNMCRAMSSAVRQMHSLKLRQALSNELARIGRTVEGLPAPTSDPTTEETTVGTGVDTTVGTPVRTTALSSTTGSTSTGERGDERSERGEAATKRRPQKRATPAPDIFPPTDSMLRYVAEHDIPREIAKIETQRFLDHHRSKGNTFKDWQAAWRTWMGRVVADRAKRGEGPTPAEERDVRGAGGFILDSSLT